MSSKLILAIFKSARFKETIIALRITHLLFIEHYFIILKTNFEAFFKSNEIKNLIVHDL